MMEPLAMSKWTPDTRADGVDDALRNLDRSFTQAYCYKEFERLHATDAKWP
jgi:hypothetical protein